MIHNLSKFASAKGLREKLSFKVGYDTPSSKVEQMLTKAWHIALEKEIIGLQSQHEVEFGIIETGDHAVEWGVYYYTKEVASLRRTRMALYQIFLETASAENISLATPMTHTFEQQ